MYRPLFLTIILVLAAVLPLSIRAASVALNGGNGAPVSIEPERSSGLDAVWVVNSDPSVPLKAVYTPSVAGASVAWSRFSVLGAAYAEPVAGASGYELDGLVPDMGYIVTEGNRQYCFWVTDYASRPFELRNVTVGDSDCYDLTLIADGTGARMTYTGINGRAVEIDREITVSYLYPAYDEQSGVYAAAEVTKNFSYLHSELHLAAPLADTRYTVSGDRFLRQWGREESVTSPVVTATAVSATVTVTQGERESADNEQKVETSGALGGSAPVEISFSAAVTDAAVFTEWQMASDADFNLIDLRFTDTAFDYTFSESGTTYVRFICANADGSCTYTGETFTVEVGTSDLRCPNAFSPGASPGVNDEWRVSYKSIVSFDCLIFTRSGRQVAHLTDPSQGWDGRIGGKTAPAGVYYYVIKAEGADGRKYNLSGDINIVGYR